jgi:N-acetyl-gamma-glutamyl-phosphate reductase
VSGYGGGELARLLTQHPDVTLTYVTSGTYAAQPVEYALPGFAGRSDLVCEKFEAAAATDRCDVVFLAGEAGFAMQHAPALLAAGKKVIDLSADFRLRDPAVYTRWYKQEHNAVDWNERAAYGLPEMNKEAIVGAQVIANPGCYPTSAILALAPLLAHKKIDPNAIIIDSLSGVSGAGRSKFGLDYHFSEVNESVRPYGVAGTHRHTPEIEQALTGVAGREIVVSFTPHLIPITRGILTTAYGNLTGSGDDLHALYRDFYANAPFVIVLEPGRFPATKHVYGTNYCYIGLAVDPRTNRVTVVSAIDNLVKGAAGQAIQNMNIICGFEETAGLNMAAVWP